MLSLTALAMLAGQAWALDLPVKRIKGKQYYYHKVKKGESIYGLSKHLGLSIEEILASNPEAADGISKGDILIFPVDEYTPTDASDSTAENTTDTFGSTRDAKPDTVEHRKKPAIAMLLPFGLNSSEPTRANTLALDFYKGALIAADSLSKSPGPVTIISRDIDGMSAQAISHMVATDTLLNTATVIIGPEDDTSLIAIADAAAENGSYVFNVLNVRDSLYATNRFAVQANVPQRQMYKLAVDALMADFDGYQPVILHSATGRNNKAAFTAYLTERYRELGIEPRVIEYQTNLLTADMEVLPTDAGEKYVIIPSDGSITEFNRFAHVLRALRDRLGNAQDTTGTLASGQRARLEVFGYPDWTAFRGDALDLLHRLGATVYSRFFDDFNGFSVRNIASDFKYWYGTTMLESAPTYGILGYDTATYLIKNIRQHSGVYNPNSVLPYSGIQSTFDFVPSGEGYVNNSIYIIRYLAGGGLAATVQ